MSSLYRRKPRRKTGNHWLPITAISLIVVATGCLGYFLFRNKIKVFFEGTPAVIKHSNAEANENLERLLTQLSGNKAQLLELQDNERARLGWIKDAAAKQRFRWILMMRLIEQSEWERAMIILPDVIHLANAAQLELLAIAALEHNDLELQLQLDERLQEIAMQSSTKIQLLLRSIERTAESAIRLQRREVVFKSLTRLELPAVRSRLTRPEDASLAAKLLMYQVEVSEVKDPILQKVRNILEAAKWPESPVTSELIVREVGNALRDNPSMDEKTLREVSSKLLKSRDSMLSENSELRLLPECYYMLGELSYRLKEYDEAAQALSLAQAFAEGYQQLTPERHIEIRRLQFKVNEERGDTESALAACRYLLEHDKDAGAQMRYLLFLAKQAKAEEKIALYLQTWKLLEDQPQLAEIHSIYRHQIARDLAAHYEKEEKYAAATEWYQAYLKLTEASPNTLTTGRLLEMRQKLALLHRKQNKDSADATALRMLQAVIDEIKALDEESRDKLDRARPKLYKDTVRELARTYLVRGDSYTARRVARTIREGLPSKTR